MSDLFKFLFLVVLVSASYAERTNAGPLRSVAFAVPVVLVGFVVLRLVFGFLWEAEERDRNGRKA